ncbi:MULTISPECIES: PP2C family protein-serine/threonine phosphatase [Psychrilyobacter]|uniref:Serine/threonine-protein phosphatase n=1 Tax=Psychrilyobacter piezotolerans TaxID=2293438 RepID=A0ABX9KIY8_9FUSO|nr:MULTISPECIES: PP2C family serine/threonine-protein phosphatase [Psychrilyobacter]MCS5422203.1 serine/threonine-protein phosphatase [Psychrilyobacter sp. S5]NDI77150.1 serine/threonine-protein phosphatase [Psychrilyobacter piezotolerans]RDE64142.1 serine/threonine-protein phosphatase [Psychrilyobacter sp. S5]REI42234.1 serine/threonine-protein phosphatase [Psychrilyobacter piezotolerans]
MILDVRYFSNKGKYRENNQDSLLIETKVVSNDVVKEKKIHIATKNYCFAIADGMGGLKKGKEASETALNILKDKKIKNKNDVKILLKDINIELTKTNLENNEKTGTTLSAISFNSKEAILFNIGDTRIYRFSTEDDKLNLELLTEDHTLAYRAFLEERVSRDMIRAHPQKNILTSCLTNSYNFPNEFFYKKIHYKPNDVFLICSDGIWENFSEEELKHIFSYKRYGNTFRWLKEKKYDIARDNMTAILIKVKASV